MATLGEHLDMLTKPSGLLGDVTNKELVNANTRVRAYFQSMRINFVRSNPLLLGAGEIFDRSFGMERELPLERYNAWYYEEHGQLVALIIGALLTNLNTSFSPDALRIAIGYVRASAQKHYGLC